MTILPLLELGKDTKSLLAFFRALTSKPVLKKKKLKKKKRKIKKRLKSKNYGI